MDTNNPYHSSVDHTQADVYPHSTVGKWSLGCGVGVWLGLLSLLACQQWVWVIYLVIVTVVSLYQLGMVVLLFVLVGCVLGLIACFEQNVRKTCGYWGLGLNGAALLLLLYGLGYALD